MSERKQAARASLLTLIKRYVNPVKLGQESMQRLQDAVNEIEAAAIEAHTALHNPNPAEAFAGGVHPENEVVKEEGTHDAPVLTVDATSGEPIEGGGISIYKDGVERLSVPNGQPAIVNAPAHDESHTQREEAIKKPDESEADHPGDGQPHA